MEKDVKVKEPNNAAAATLLGVALKGALRFGYTAKGRYNIARGIPHALGTAAYLTAYEGNPIKTVGRMVKENPVETLKRHAISAAIIGINKTELYEKLMRTSRHAIPTGARNVNVGNIYRDAGDLFGKTAAIGDLAKLVRKIPKPNIRFIGSDPELLALYKGIDGPASRLVGPVPQTMYGFGREITMKGKPSQFWNKAKDIAGQISGDSSTFGLEFNPKAMTDPEEAEEVFRALLKATKKNYLPSNATMTSLAAIPGQSAGHGGHLHLDILKNELADLKTGDLRYGGGKYLSKDDPLFLKAILSGIVNQYTVGGAKIRARDAHYGNTLFDTRGIKTLGNGVKTFEARQGPTFLGSPEQTYSTYGLTQLLTSHPDLHNDAVALGREMMRRTGDGTTINLFTPSNHRFFGNEIYRILTKAGVKWDPKLHKVLQSLADGKPNVDLDISKAWRI